MEDYIELEKSLERLRRSIDNCKKLCEEYSNACTCKKKGLKEKILSIFKKNK